MSEKLKAPERPQKYVCAECGEFIENCVEFSSCPKGHGKLRHFLDSSQLSEIKGIRFRERAVAALNALPDAVVAEKRPRRISFNGSSGLVVQRRIKTVDELFKRFKRGRCVARIEGIKNPSPTGWYVLVPARERKAVAH